MGNSIKTKNVIITEELDYRNLGNQLKYKPITKNIYLKVKQIEDTLEIYTFSNKKIFHGFKIDKNTYRIDGFSNSPNSRGEIIWDNFNITINLTTSLEISDIGEYKPNISLKGHFTETNRDNGKIYNEIELKIFEEMDKTKIAILDKDIKYKLKTPISYHIKQLGDYIIITQSKVVLYVGKKQEKPLWFNEDFSEYFVLFTENNGYLAIKPNKIEKTECIITIWGSETPINKSEKGFLINN